MFGALSNLFRVEDIRKRMFVTLGLLFVYRIGYHIPIPGVNITNLRIMLEHSSDNNVVGNMLGLLSRVSGANLRSPMIFALGVLPYISSSIIFSLLQKTIPSLEALAKEGASGARKLNQYARLLTVPLCLVQALGLCFAQYKKLGVGEHLPVVNEFGMGFVVTACLGITAGTIFLMWLGEQITEYGVGNGTSLLIVTGIVADVPLAFWRILSNAGHDRTQIVYAVVLAVVYFFIVVGVVYMSRGQRRIPMQQAKQMRGQRMMGGSRSYLPIKVNMPNVMPVIFTTTLLAIPGSIWSWATNQGGQPSAFHYGSWLYVLVQVAMIMFFSFFWTSLMFQPDEIANNLKESGSFVPGLRPGRKTAEFLEKVLTRITLFGAVCLATIAIIPELASQVMGVDQLVASFLGGTGILIVVGVTLDVVDKLNSSLLMRNYEGFMGSGKNKPTGTGPR